MNIPKNRHSVKQSAVPVRLYIREVKRVVKRGLLAVLLCALLCVGVACAEAFSYTIRTNWVTGEARSVFSGGEVHGLTFALEDERYTVTDAAGETVVWGAEGIARDGFCADLLPRSLEEVRRMNRVMAYLADDALSGTWATVDLGQNRTVPVYAAPSEDAWRGANGRAAVSFAEPFTLLASFGNEGWWLIEYAIGDGARRVGYIPQQAYDRAAPYGWWLIPMTLSLCEDATMTDDPHGARREIARFAAGESLTVLGYYDGLWAYAQTEIDGKTARGFVPLRALTTPEEEPLTDVMAELTGEWAFAGGGEVLGLAGVIFSGDGKLCSCTTDDDESVFPAEHLIPDGTWHPYAVYVSPDRVYGERVPYVLEVTPGDGTVRRYSLEWIDASEARSGRDTLGVYVGEGGGFYQRMGEPEFPPQPEEAPGDWG